MQKGLVIKIYNGRVIVNITEQRVILCVILVNYNIFSIFYRFRYFERIRRTRQNRYIR
jgi:hypothetical protein